MGKRQYFKWPAELAEGIAKVQKRTDVASSAGGKANTAPLTLPPVDWPLEEVSEVPGGKGATGRWNGGRVETFLGVGEGRRGRDQRRRRDW